MKLLVVLANGKWNDGATCVIYYGLSVESKKFPNKHYSLFSRKIYFYCTTA